MLINLTASVTFPTTGKQLSHSVSYQPGLTAITGRNGRGKTFLGVEMPRWLLFGTKALREQKSEYKDLTGSLNFSIEGEIYNVSRSPIGEKLTNASGTVVAIGADAVNKKIVDLFGYGLDVFDLANACLQGKVEELGKMAPAERKATVDRLIGLDRLEAIEKQCRGEALALSREAKALLSARQPLPPPPEVRAGGRPSAPLFAAAALAEEVERQRVQAQAIVNAVGARPPAPPAPALVDKWRQDVLVLQEKERLQRDLAKIVLYPVFEDHLIDAAEAWLDYLEAAAARGPQPTMTIDEVEQTEQDWDHHLSWRPMEPCPACGFGANHPEQPEQPKITRAQLQQERLRIDRWGQPLIAPPAPKDGGLTRAEIAASRAAAAEQARFIGLSDQIAALVADENAPALLRAAEQAMAVEAAWIEREAAAADARALLESLPAPVDIEFLRSEAFEAQLYETEVSHYLTAKSAYDNITKQASERQERAEGQTAGASALKEVRVEVKSHLAPAISLVASQLLATMSNGEFTKLDVSPDFELRVNGQTIKSLSGSEAAVANLALRLALGRVLTTRVFPVFLGDEIDASMDADRAEATAETVRALSKVLKQVIVVTHKDIDTDNYIIL